MSSSNNGIKNKNKTVYANRKLRPQLNSTSHNAIKITPHFVLFVSIDIIQINFFRDGLHFFVNNIKQIVCKSKSVKRDIGTSRKCTFPHCTDSQYCTRIMVPTEKKKSEAIREILPKSGLVYSEK